jgi:hypothetical protein
MKKIKITESGLYNIIKQVLLEQEKEKEEEKEEEKVWYTNHEEFKFRLFKVFDGNSEKFAKYHNKYYDKIVVDGSLDLRRTQITSLPDNLHVGGSLYLNGTLITSLPDNLHVGGWLGLSKAPITSLPDNLKVKGYIYIYRTPLNDNDELVREYEAKGYKIDKYS